MPGASAKAGADLLLGLDLSTTAVKALAFEPDGKVVAVGRVPLRLANPVPGGYEQDALDWWAATCAALRIVTAEVDPHRFRGMCLAHQRETCVVVDGTGQPCHPALVWMDERCAIQVAGINHDPVLSRRIHELSGKPWCTTPGLAKLLWLREQDPTLLRPPRRILDVQAFLVHRWTGQWLDAEASADPLGLLEVATGRWSPELLALLGVAPTQLPELRPGGTVLAGLLPAAAAACGLPAGLPVVAGAGDGQAATLGAGLLGPGRGYLNLGTAVVAGLVVPAPQIDRAFRTMIGAVPGTYLLESDLKGGTFTLDWLARRLLRSGEPPEQKQQLLQRLEREALGLPPGSQGLVALPYWCGVMNPYWDDQAAGVLLGLREHHGPAHLYRSILEGIACEQRLALEAMGRAIGTPLQELVVVGGGADSRLWCHLLADLTGAAVVRSATREATALGAAILAAVATGVHPDLPCAVKAMCREEPERFQPGPARSLYDQLFREVYAPLFPAVQPLLHRLRAVAG